MTLFQLFFSSLPCLAGHEGWVLHMLNVSLPRKGAHDGGNLQLSGLARGPHPSSGSNKSGGSETLRLLHNDPNDKGINSNQYFPHHRHSVGMGDCIFKTKLWSQ